MRDLNINSENSEANHWIAFKMGNAASFSHFYDKYSKGLYNYGSKFSKDKDIIKDTVQELFVEIWTKRQSVGNPEHIKNYLYKGFRNLIFKKVSRLKDNYELDENENYEFNVSLNVEEALIDDERRKQISAQLQLTISRLTPRQREAIFLKFYEQLSYEEIAEVMGITVKASYKLMARSLDLLRSNLSKDIYLTLLLALDIKLLS